jgi:transcriptional regulator with XRE-family HTH domain
MFDPERIRRARMEAGLSQQALAARIGKSTDTVRGYEKGRIQPPGDVVDRIADATGKAPEWFLTHRQGGAVASYDPDEPAMPGGLQRLIDMGLPLREDELETLVGFADPLNTSRGARGAMGWTPGQWLDVLLEERRRHVNG